MNIKDNFLHRILRYTLVFAISFSIISTGSAIWIYAEPESAVSSVSDTDNSQTTTDNISDNTINHSQTASWPAYPEISAEAGVLIEASTGTVLYDKNCHQQMYPASITKIMTTLLALENGNLSDMVEYYHYDVYSLEYGAANIARQEGEQLSLNDTLYAVMLASANECANATGEYVARKTKTYTDKIAELDSSGQSYDADKIAISVFADMMNERAKEAGALGTHFSNPNGLFSEDHYTTAYDMAMITRAAIKNDDFLKIESNTSHVIPVTNKNAETQTVYQRHKMMYSYNTNYYEGILGGKTGYVDESGSTLVTFAKRNGMTLISVILKSTGLNVYNDTRTLLDYGFNNFSLSNIAENETKFSVSGLGNLSNFNSVFDTNSVLLELSTEGNVVLPNGVTIADCVSKLSFDSSDFDKDGKDSLSTDTIAKINYYYNDVNVGGTNLLLNKNDMTFTFGPAKETKTTEPVKTKSKKYIHINIWFLLGGIFVVILIIALIYYNRMRQNWSRVRRRKRRKKNSGSRSKTSLSYSSRKRGRRKRYY